MRRSLVISLLLALLLTTISFAESVSIAKGDSGDQVVKVQKRLIELGFLSGEADGAFGVNTQNAVVAFQVSEGLEPSGVVDDTTYSALGIDGDIDSSSSEAGTNLPEIPVSEDGYPIVDYVYLANHPDRFTDQRVMVHLYEPSVYGSEISESNETYTEITVEVSDLSEYKYNDYEYVTVMGTVSSSSSDYSVKLKDGEVLYAGNTKPEDYDSIRVIYNQIQAIENQDARSAFISSAQECSYDDLRRYPDSFKGQPIKLNLVITEVQADGWISQGDIYAHLNGDSEDSQVYVIDNRAIREPRFLEGDVITVYAQGGGLATIKVKEGPRFLPTWLGRTVDSYEIPKVNVIYTDLDASSPIPDDGSAMKDLTSTDLDTLESQYWANQGEAAAQKVNEFFGVD